MVGSIARSSRRPKALVVLAVQYFVNCMVDLGVESALHNNKENFMSTNVEGKS
jgi:hypothetical protein